MGMGGAGCNMQDAWAGIWVGPRAYHVGNLRTAAVVQELARSPVRQTASYYCNANLGEGTGTLGSP